MRDVVYEYYASQSGLEPEDVFTLEQHKHRFYSGKVSAAYPDQLSGYELAMLYFTELYGVDTPTANTTEYFTDNVTNTTWRSLLITELLVTNWSYRGYGYGGYGQGGYGNL